MVDPLRAGTALRRRGGPLGKHAPHPPTCKSGTYLPHALLHAGDVPSACTSACGRYVPDLQSRLRQTGQSSLDAPASPRDDQRCYGVAERLVALRVLGEPPVLVAAGRRGGSRSRLFGSACGRYVPNLHARRRYVPNLHSDQMKKYAYRVCHCFSVPILHMRRTSRHFPSWILRKCRSRRDDGKTGPKNNDKLDPAQAAFPRNTQTTN